MSELPSLPILPVSVDYRGVTPVSGDHVAIPLAAWADICFAVGYASITDDPTIKQAAESVRRRYPIIRFGSDNAEATDV